MAVHFGECNAQCAGIFQAEVLGPVVKASWSNQWQQIQPREVHNSNDIELKSETLIYVKQFKIQKDQQTAVQWHVEELL
jgi:hypothetical protein